MGEFLMPSLGSQMIQARLVQWFVKPGDKVRRGDIIGEIDTEKGLIDIEVFESGTIAELRAREGDVVPVGSVMAVIKNGEERETIAKAPTSQAGETPRPAEPSSFGEGPGGRVPRRLRATPLARRVAEDLGVDLNEVHGTGPEGSIHRGDVESHARHAAAVGGAPAGQPQASAAEEIRAAEAPAPGAEESQMRQAIASAMARSNREIPHYYLLREVDMKAALDWMQEENRNRPLDRRLFPPVLMIKAVALALADSPRLNGYWMDGRLQPAEGIHVGFVISLRSGGVLVPAIRDADRKPVDQIREEFVDMVSRAREGHLRSGEIGSATVTVSHLGDRGAEQVFGLIYPPQVALIGMGAIRQVPRVVDDAIGIRPVLSVVLAGDHRATDGHEGSRFLDRLDELFQQPADL